MLAVRYRAVVGAVVAHLRRRLCLTQQNVGEIVGLTVSQWGRIEGGHAPLTVDHLRTLAEPLGESPSAILAWADRVAIHLAARDSVEVVADGVYPEMLHASDLGVAVRQCAPCANFAPR